jgi:hypothetical protein
VQIRYYGYGGRDRYTAAYGYGDAAYGYGSATYGRGTTAYGYSGPTYLYGSGAYKSDIMGDHEDEHAEHLEPLDAELVEALEENRPSTWEDSEKGYKVTVTPTRTYSQEGWQYCREYKKETAIEGGRVTVYETACRGQDGHWTRRK